MSEDKKLKSLEEYNKKAKALEVYMRTFKSEVKWVPTGIESGFGGEILLAKRDLSGYVTGISYRHRLIKCSETGRTGYMIVDGSIRDVIKSLEWD